MRPTHFSGGVTENAISPRFGVALNVPRLKWTFRASYGHYYQPPPLITASGPLLEFANRNNLGFIALHGERDEEEQFGVNIPWRGWILDADMFRTKASIFSITTILANRICSSRSPFNAPLFAAGRSVCARPALLAAPRFSSPPPIRLRGPEDSSTAGGLIFPISPGVRSITISATRLASAST